MNHNINLLSLDNDLKVYEVDFQHNYISFEVGNSMNCFTWKGIVIFIKDSNGIGDSWIDFESDIEVVCMNEEKTEYDEQHVIEHVAQELYNAEYVDAMKGDYS